MSAKLKEGNIMKNFINILAVIIVALGLFSCEDFLNVTPEDRITNEMFWENQEDAQMALMGIYSVLQDNGVYGYGGGNDAKSSNAHQWAHWEGKQLQIGNGTVTPDIGGNVLGRWTDSYRGINRVNVFLENIDNVEGISESAKETMIGEAYFLRGVFYALLANSYGGVPVFTNPITAEEARSLTRATLEETWNQVHSDYDKAIARLNQDAPQAGRATLGAAYGMKMRAYLYQRDWDKVIEYADTIIDMNKYGLFHSYEGLFQVENEHNEEVIFNVEFMEGPRGQGSIFDRYWQPQNLENGINGSNSVAPIQHLVDAYGTLDGSQVDPENPYENRDPRLDFTILRPGAYFQGQLYPDELQNHTGQQVGFGIRKYTIEGDVTQWESPLNFIVLRYADVLLSKAEALIEKDNPNIAEAVRLINRIRTERDDVSMPSLSTSLSLDEARVKLRHERRIEFALEGLYWADEKRWDMIDDFRDDLYPIEVRSRDGGLIDTKFEGGFDSMYNRYPIPESEISLNPDLEQNPGY
ncbi:RagB/SusD family nutrient uptake outer membrane protein [Fodinibius sediminis]|uniref:RagB/SusD domain-containing protein n=1 Tax=Fodinibius sediminis TaxID=1214077 RepID=A0A521EAV0_9BACT|nr:RagB/SusD family nutrient uptake outer membrane protein [Fodinibius sediminis]SMO81049.1 RagB/SusD domain-containing protein [Fodinibius sediminis]